MHYRTADIWSGRGAALLDKEARPPGAYVRRVAYVSCRTDKAGRLVYKVKSPLPVSFPPGYKPLNGFAPGREGADAILTSKAHLERMLS